VDDALIWILMDPLCIHINYPSETKTLDWFIHFNLFTSIKCQQLGLSENKGKGSTLTLIHIWTPAWLIISMRSPLQAVRYSFCHQPSLVRAYHLLTHVLQKLTGSFRSEKTKKKAQLDSMTTTCTNIVATQHKAKLRSTQTIKETWTPRLITSPWSSHFSLTPAPLLSRVVVVRLRVGLRLLCVYRSGSLSPDDIIYLFFLLSIHTHSDCVYTVLFWPHCSFKECLGARVFSY
jgi:hypothetical protein